MSRGCVRAPKIRVYFLNDKTFYKINHLSWGNLELILVSVKVPIIWYANRNIQILPRYAFRPTDYDLVMIVKRGFYLVNDALKQR